MPPIGPNYPISGFGGKSLILPCIYTAVSRYEIVIDLMVLFQKVFFFTSYKILSILALYFLNFISK